MVRYAKGHKDASREKIVAHASTRLRKDGIKAVGVRGLMTEAGLTHGAFYAHFPARSDLVAAAMDHAMEDTIQHLRHVVSNAADGRGLEALVRSYLSAAHCAHVELGCAAAALAGELAREPLPIREGFLSHIDEITDLIASTLPSAWTQKARTERAYAIFSALMGSLQLMRLASHPDQIKELMQNGRKAALILAAHP